MRKILLIDNCNDVFKKLKELFSDKNIELRLSNCSNEILSVVEDFLPDIILFAIANNNESGIEILKDLKEKYPLKPIVVLTKSPSSRLIIKALRIGVFNVISLPYHPQAVLQIINNAYEKVEKIREKKRLQVDIHHTNQKLIELNHFKDDIASTIVHDLRNPLAIMNAAWEIVSEFKPVNCENHIEQIIFQEGLATERILQIIDDMTEIYRISEPKLELKKKEINLHSLISDSCKLLNQLATNLNVSLKFETKANIKVIGDSNRLGQIFENIISNAIYFTPSMGKVSVKLSITGANKTKEAFAKIEIIDTGIGIEKKLFQKIFRKYVSFNNSPHGYYGIGLGLYIVKELVKLHDGKLKVASIPGKGSRFIILLPVAA